MGIWYKQWSADSTFHPKAALQFWQIEAFFDLHPTKIQQGLPPLDQFCSGLCLFPLTRIDICFKQLYIRSSTNRIIPNGIHLYISKVKDSIPSHIGSKVPLALGKPFSSHWSDHLSNNGNKSSQIPWNTGCLIGVCNNPYYNKGIENPWRNWNQPALLHCSCSIMSTKTNHPSLLK